MKVENNIAAPTIAEQTSAVLSETAVPVAPERIFTHTHSDGAEFSGTAEEARKACTVLGQMSLEAAQATLEQRDLAARVTQRGREKREAEAAKNIDKQPESKQPDVKQVEPALPSLDILKPDQSATIAEAEPVLQDYDLAAAYQQMMQAATEQSQPAEPAEIIPKYPENATEEEPETFTKPATRDDLISSIESAEPEPAAIESPKLAPTPDVVAQAEPIPPEVPDAARSFDNPSIQPEPNTLRVEVPVDQTEITDERFTEQATDQASTEPTLSAETLTALDRPDVAALEISAEADTEILSAETIVESIVRDIEPEPEVVEQVTAMIEILPEPVQTTLAEYIDHAEPEFAEPVEELIVEMAVVADQLHELAMVDQLDSAKAEQLQQTLIQQYVELLSILEIKIDEEVIKAFIEQVCAETYRSKPEDVEESFLDIFMERRPHHHFDIAGGLINTASDAAIKIARLLSVQRGFLLAET